MLITGSNTLIGSHIREATRREQNRPSCTVLHLEVRRRKLEQFYRCHNIIDTGSLLFAEAHTAH